MCCNGFLSSHLAAQPAFPTMSCTHASGRYFETLACKLWLCRIMYMYYISNVMNGLNTSTYPNRRSATEIHRRRLVVKYSPLSLLQYQAVGH